MSNFTIKYLKKINIANFKKPSLPTGMASHFACLLFLLISFGKSSAQSIFDQKVSIAVQQVSIPHALKTLGQNAQVELAFSETFFDENKKITLRETDRPLREILTLILKNTGVDFKEIDGQIVLFQAPKKEPQLFTVSGYVEDALSGERLIAAAVYCPQQGIGTITNEYGFYSLTLPNDVDEIIVSYLGYQEERKALHLSKNLFVTYQLSPSLTLAEIIVTPDSTLNELLPSPATGNHLRPDDFKAAPDLGGESDLMRIAQLLPGVQSGADGFGGLHVRGGNADQNLVLLDGVPVYNPDHLLGILSVFNTNAVKSAKFLRGSFPARYGGRVSSIFDVRTKEGSNRKWGGGAGVDLISGKGFVEGPFAKTKGSILLAGRITHSDFLLNELGQKAFFGLVDAKNDYEFYDFNAKASYQFSEKDRVFLSFYKGKDFFNGKFERSFKDSLDRRYIEFEQNTNVELRWGNTISSLRWNHVFSPKLFANTTLTYSRYQFSSEELFTISPEDEEEEEGREYFEYQLSGSNIRDRAVRTDLTFSPNARHYWRFGGAFTNHRFIPNNQTTNSGMANYGEIDSLKLGDFEDFGDEFSIYADEVECYVEDEFKVGDKWHFNLGLRLSAFFGEDDFYNVEPRLIGGYHLSEKIGLTASLTRNVQYLHRLLFNEINLPEDVWLPSENSLKPQDSWQSTLGVESNLPNGLQVSMEGYVKQMRNMYVFDPDSTKAGFLNEHGSSYGVEFFVQKTKGRTGGWLSYTLSKSNREFTDNTDQERYIISTFDRRHDLKIFLYQRLKERWQVSLNWLYGTPLPQLYAPATNSELNTNGQGPPTPHNSLPVFHYRSPVRSIPYHRLDLALSYFLKKQKSEHTFKVSLYNAYSRKNPAFYRQEYEAGIQVIELKPVSLLPAMPGVYYGVKF